MDLACAVWAWNGGNPTALMPVPMTVTPSRALWMWDSGQSTALMPAPEPGLVMTPAIGVWTWGGGHPSPLAFARGVWALASVPSSLHTTPSRASLIAAAARTLQPNLPQSRARDVYPPISVARPDVVSLARSAATVKANVDRLAGATVTNQADQASTIAELRAEISNIQARLLTLERVGGEIQTRLTDLETRATDLETRATDLEARVYALEHP